MRNDGDYCNISHSLHNNLQLSEYVSNPSLSMESIPKRRQRRSHRSARRSTRTTRFTQNNRAIDITRQRTPTGFRFSVSTRYDNLTSIWVNAESKGCAMWRWCEDWASRRVGCRLLPWSARQGLGIVFLRSRTIRPTRRTISAASVGSARSTSGPPRRHQSPSRASESARIYAPLPPAPD